MFWITALAFFMAAADLDRACDIALQNQYGAIRQLLQDAFKGARPE